MTREQKAVFDACELPDEPDCMKRCDWCNWPIDPEGKMCRPDSCSMRPMPNMGEQTELRQYARKLRTVAERMRKDVERYHIRRKQVFDLRNLIRISGQGHSWEDFCNEYDENKPNREVG